MGKDCKVGVYTVLTLVYAMQLVFDEKIGYTHGSTWQHLVYPFFHANIFHLLANLYALSFLNINLLRIMTAFFLSVSTSFLAVCQLPTMGFSAVIFVLLGMQTNIFRSKFSFDKCFFLAYMIIGLVLPNINGLLHLLCFMEGAVIQFAVKTYADLRRADR